ncbi:MAG: hypothetical protein AB7I35_20205 [Ramlibacter sp.]
MTKLVNQINNFVAQNQDGAELTAYNSLNGQIVKEHRWVLVFNKVLLPDECSMTMWETQQVFGQHKKVHTLSIGFIKEIAGWIDTMYMTGHDYRRVLNDVNWRTLFQSEQRSVDYIHGLAPQTQMEQTLPCFRCGIVLPDTHITIDHHKPQGGGGDQAVLKNLRNMGYNLTHAPGIGSVSTAFLNGQFNPVPTKSGGAVNLGDDEGKAWRYTLTDRGAVFLSAAIAASSEQRVTDLCMHSMLNLKPYCAKCNIQKSNGLSDLQWING